MYSKLIAPIDSTDEKSLSVPFAHIPYYFLFLFFFSFPFLLTPAKEVRSPHYLHIVSRVTSSHRWCYLFLRSWCMHIHRYTPPASRPHFLITAALMAVAASETDSGPKLSEAMDCCSCLSTTFPNKRTGPHYSSQSDAQRLKNLFHQHQTGRMSDLSYTATMRPLAICSGLPCCATRCWPY
jgi:hypothetical protein